MKYLLFLGFFVLLSGLGSGLTLEEGVVFEDSNFNYTVNTCFNVSSIEVGDDFYLDGLDFCDSGYTNYFNTSRICPTLASGVGNSLEYDDEVVEEVVVDSESFDFAKYGLIVLGVLILFLLFKKRKK